VRDDEIVGDAVRGLTQYFGFHNQEPPHQALQYQTPVRVYASGVERRVLPSRPRSTEGSVLR